MDRFLNSREMKPFLTRCSSIAAALWQTMRPSFSDSMPRRSRGSLPGLFLSQCSSLDELTEKQELPRIP